MPWNDSLAQLRMVWPAARVACPPPVDVPPEYVLREYAPADEDRFYEIMHVAGWPGWDGARLRPTLSKVLPRGWFVVAERGTDIAVGTAMCLHNYKRVTPFWGNLGWLACDPAHSGRGIGKALTAAVVSRFIEAGYERIDLYSEDSRLGALKTYLRVGFHPLLYADDMPGRWEDICRRIAWPFSPARWPAEVSSA
ncbi:GNAT family N-acetyltransferase [Candidatus Poribacteria bacterium]|jgi:mycothiol synthase|nr:GNAT family N-acetyltransferase [Candidatus Poribacteria bacterium]MBT5533657.1 GNAT family N-acetyltransferase [Candidatus Poribacteria bacterium]MBT5710227.1 GNAT family N-acetyltransferase [Candidatus Poribacteria bacterium]MBT7101583.1 GNAT family N-acetyltransferase [Candidatus Poribacteria bacterium]MBT7809655.1 GNAT family N-acetyltransferase [Candidatus Poribacteria bacterium]